MITEDYVSFETAKLLKEKGFDGDFSKAYSTNGTLISNFTEDCIIAPTLQMAMKWLREVHNLHCDIGYDFRLGWNNKITSLKETVIDHDIEMKTYPIFTIDYSSYEEACEAGIRYCLEKLI